MTQGLPRDPGPVPLSGLLPDELAALMQEMGQKPYRGKQLFEAIHRQGITSLEQVTTLSKSLREALMESSRPVRSLNESANVLSQDGTRKLAYSTHDGKVIETVLIPMESGSYTQCISSQVGCALKCRFCMTGQLGFQRNLTAAEIVDQHALALQYTGERSVRNIVFMGMGEPLLNVDNVVKAIRILTNSLGRDMSGRRITVSTAGVIPGIERLAVEAPVMLAVSLNAPDQAIRERIMPISSRYPLDQLLATLKKWPLRPRQRMTFEYVLLPGVNDSAKNAADLVKLLSNHRAKVNLIPFNPHPGSEYTRPTREQVDRFAAILGAKHMTVTVRQSRGQDIDAACGQLAGAIMGDGELDESEDDE